MRRSNARIAAYKRKYEEISEITAIPQDTRRMAVTRAKNSGNVLQSGGGSGIIDMYRNTTNTGAFSHPPERMSKKHIRTITKECGINLKGISLNIDSNEELLALPITGRADYENIGQITFFPNAFRSKEELVRTLFHEVQHVKQFKNHGTEYVQNNRGQFENETYELETNFIKLLKERGVL